MRSRPLESDSSDPFSHEEPSVGPQTFVGEAERDSFRPWFLEVVAFPP